MVLRHIRAVGQEVQSAGPEAGDPARSPAVRMEVSARPEVHRMAAAETRADPFPGKAVVLYDGDCPFCRKSVAILRKLDWLDRLASRLSSALNCAL